MGINFASQVADTFLERSKLTACMFVRTNSRLQVRDLLFDLLQFLLRFQSGLFASFNRQGFLHEGIGAGDEKVTAPRCGRYPALALPLPQDALIRSKIRIEIVRGRAGASGE